MKAGPSGQGMLRGEPVLRPPEQDVLMAGAGLHPAAGGETAANLSARADLDARPDRAVGDHRALSDRAAADHASPRTEAGPGHGGKDASLLVESAAASRERSAAVENFERRAQEIARSAEVRKRPRVPEPPDSVEVLPDEGLPQVGHESPLPRRDPGQEPRGHHANAGVEERIGAAAAESRDSIPFGLKRRIPAGIPILHDEERRRPAASPMVLNEALEVRINDGVRVEKQKIASREPVRGISQGARGAEDFRLREEANIREIRRAIAQLAFDLFAKMMKIDARFEDAVARQEGQVLPEKRDV